MLKPYKSLKSSPKTLILPRIGTATLVGYPIRASAEKFKRQTSLAEENPCINRGNDTAAQSTLRIRAPKAEEAAAGTTRGNVPRNRPHVLQLEGMMKVPKLREKVECESCANSMRSVELN